MASVLSLPPQPFPPWSSARRWPADASRRWAFRLVIAVPFVGLAVWARHLGFVSAEHVELERQAEAVARGGAALNGLNHAYPPIPTFLAGVLPGNTLALSVVGGLFAGIVVQILAERLVARRVPPVVAVPLLFAVVGAPAAVFLATEALPGIAVTALFALALDGFGRFVIDRDTESGFIAGLSIAVAAGFDDIALLFAVALAIAAPSIAGARYRSEPGSAMATLAVVLFPVTFASLAWAFLEWRFAGRLTGSVPGDPALFAFPGGWQESFDTAARTVLRALAHVPLYVLGAVLCAWRRPTVLTGYLAPVLALVLAAWLGVHYSAVLAYLLLTYVAVVSVRGPESRVVRGALVVVAVGQIVLAWVWPPAAPAFPAWFALLT